MGCWGKGAGCFMSTFVYGVSSWLSKPVYLMRAFHTWKRVYLNLDLLTASSSGWNELSWSQLQLMSLSSEMLTQSGWALGWDTAFHEPCHKEYVLHKDNIVSPPIVRPQPISDLTLKIRVLILALSVNWQCDLGKVITFLGFSRPICKMRELNFIALEKWIQKVSDIRTWDGGGTLWPEHGTGKPLKLRSSEAMS